MAFAQNVNQRFYIPEAVWYVQAVERDIDMYIQKTGKKYRPTIEHPIGKYFIAFSSYGRPILEFLLEKEIDGWLTSGIPMEEKTVVRKGMEVIRKARKIWYFDTKEEAISKLASLVDGWREGQNVYLVTNKGFRIVKKGKDIS